MKAVRQAFEKWVKKMWNDTVVTSTPLRPSQTDMRSAAAVRPAQDSSQFEMSRQKLSESAVRTDAAASSMMLEKKRKIQLDSIPE